MWDIKLKTINTNRQQYASPQREGDEVVEDNGGQIYGDGRRFDCEWWVQNVIYRSHTIDMYS